jgi:fatty acyl-CoA reductase
MSGLDEYPSSINGPIVISDVDSVQRTREVIGKRPNTYTYTKAIAEQLIGLERDDLPIAIIRPSIVVAGMRGPLKGWVDNMNGATGMP